MKTKQKTVAAAKVRDVVGSLIKSGYKELQFGQNRVPVGSSERLNIYARRWCGDWSGYQSFCAAVLYK